MAPRSLPGDPKGSLILRLMTGSGKTMMPPKDEHEPRPTAEEIAVVESWIASGARGPSGQEPSRLALLVPRIAPKGRVRPIVAMDASRDGRWTAVARDTEVTLLAGTGDAVTRGDRPARSIGKFPARSRPCISPRWQATGGGLGRGRAGGSASIWNVEDGSLVRTFEGHRDLLYDAEISPDGSRLATCGYDR